MRLNFLMLCAAPHTTSKFPLSRIHVKLIMLSLRIYLFGTPRLDVNGEIPDIRRRKGLALLAFLAVTGQPHTREALATMLWPENGPSIGLANLRRELSRLQQALGEGVPGGRPPAGRFQT